MTNAIAKPDNQKQILIPAKSSLIHLLFVGLAVLLLNACVSRLPVAAGVPEISPSDYESAVRARTNKVENYDGLYNTLTVQATWLDSQLTENSLSHSARLSQWNEIKYREEREKKVTFNASNTQFFVSLYTPERRHADLGAKDLWKIYLEVNGQRYEGKASKIRWLLTEIQALYPYHNRWSTPYFITFPVATSLVEGKPAKLIVTGAVSTAEVKFNQ